MKKRAAVLFIILFLLASFLQRATAAKSAQEPKDIFKKIKPAVVYIVAKGAQGQEYLGSGFILDKTGVVVTNYHLIKSPKEIYVRVPGGKVYPATAVIYFDVTKDIFIFKIEQAELEQVELGDSDLVEVGDAVYCIGNPLGLEYSFSDGLVSGLREAPGAKYIQFTAPISMGNSGGPLVSRQGQVIGIVTFLMGGGQNLNFALAINELKPYITLAPKISFAEFASNIAQASGLVNQGLRSYFSGNTDEAVKFLKQALELDPSIFAAYSLLGNIYLAQEKNERALFYLEKALRLEPNNPYTYESLGITQRMLGNFPQAAFCLEKAIQLNPNRQSAYISLGELLYENKEFAKAIAVLEKAIRLNPRNIYPYVDIFLCYQSLGQPDKAALYFRRAAQINPAHPELYYVRGVIYLNEKKYKQARQDLEKSRYLYMQMKHYRRLRQIDEYLSKIPKEVGNGQ